MNLTMLFKDPESGGGGCPSVYLAEDGHLVVQGPRVDAATRGNLRDVLDDEEAVRISPDVLLGALSAYQDRPTARRG